ncbi:hypothetical protein KEM54_001127 [Ascosphaera aggregata]|nr:hypothetical protein KEM54_001127 [Ascosphaera aggregata]
MSGDTIAQSSQSLLPVELSFRAPKALDGRIHLHMTALAAATILFITSTSYGDSGAVNKPLGSFVCAIPDRISPKSSLCTPLNAVPSTIDFASRTARILSQRMKVPVYVGCSMNLSGYTPDEEMESLSKIIEAVMARWKDPQLSAV